MGVKLLDNEAFYGYRVRRTVDAKLFQEYFSLKQSGKRINGATKNKIKDQAFKRDSELSLLQAKRKQSKKADRCFNANGTVRGISYLVKTEKSGTKTPIFQVGIASEADSKIICTSYSINAHGKDRAWKLAVDTYTKHKGISKAGKLYRELLAAMPARVTTPAARKKAASKMPARKKLLGQKAVKKAAKKAPGKAVRKTAVKRVAAKKASSKKVVSKKMVGKPVAKKKVAKKR